MEVARWSIMPIDEEAIFCGRHRAIDSPSERAAYLDRGCAATIRHCARSVEALLAGSRRSRTAFWKSPPARSRGQSTDQPARSADSRPRHGHRPVQAAGSRSAKGAWASSTWPSRPQPVRRRVALKIIKPGMDTPAGHRPLRGRAAGAGADGPSRTSPGCSTPGRPTAGRPYFVMELVRGVPITEYCDEQPADRRASGWSCSCRSARRCSTPIRRGSSTATSSRPTCWSRCTTASRCPR